jgi:hypothetical protein
MADAVETCIAAAPTVLWRAQTQMNLGLSLWRLGERESGTARLEEAVTAWDACLTVTATVWPSEWIRYVRDCRDEAQSEIERRTTK